MLPLRSGILEKSNKQNYIESKQKFKMITQNLKQFISNQKTKNKTPY